MLVAKTLLTVREGDLLSLTVTPGDGGGHLASGEDETREIWMTVTKISTSTGGRRQLEGESNGLRVQLIDQGRGLQGARLGVAGPVLAKGSLAPKDRWIEALPGWSRVLTRPADLERGVLSSVTRVAVVASLDRLEQALESDHRPWTTGASSPMRRAVIVDPVEAATQTAGELLALLRGKRDVALCQLHAGWLPPDKQPVLKSPWALTMLKRCVEDPEIEFEMSVSDDVEAHAGISVALYRRDAPGAGAGARARGGPGARRARRRRPGRAGGLPRSDAVRARAGWFGAGVQRAGRGVPPQERGGGVFGDVLRARPQSVGHRRERRRRRRRRAVRVAGP